MNPLYHSISSCLSRKTFEISIKEGGFGVSVQKGEKVNDNCQNTMFQLAFLIHGELVAERLLWPINVGYRVSFKAEGVSEWIFRDEMLFHSRATTLTLFESSSEAFHRDEFQEMVKKNHHKCIEYFKADLKKRLATLVDVESDREIDHHSLMMKALKGCIKKTRAVQFLRLKNTISKNESLLNPELGMMYYVVICSHHNYTESWKGHAFAVQQKMGSDGVPNYFLWQSWENTFHILDKPGCMQFYEGGIWQFTEDLITIFDRGSWEEDADTLWKKWFAVSLFEKIHNSLDLVKYYEIDEHSYVYLDSTSVSFTYGRYNPLKIESSVKNQFSKLLEGHI